MWQPAQPPNPLSPAPKYTVSSVKKLCEISVMVRTVLRNFLMAASLFFLLAAALALGLDAMRLSSHGASCLTPLGEFWTHLDPDSLALVQGALPAQTWDLIGVWVLLQPASAVLGFVGFFLLVLRPIRERRRASFT